MKDIEIEVDEMLHSWGEWAANHGVNIGYPKQTPYRKLVGASVSQAGIDQNTALEIDKAVSELEAIDKDAKTVVEYFYILKTPLSSMKAACDISQPKAKTLRRFAITYCLGRLYEHVAT